MEICAEEKYSQAWFFVLIFLLLLYFISNDVMAWMK
jgi:hypothetical protein